MTKDTLQTQVAVIAERTTTIAKDVSEIKSTLEKDYVTQDQFLPVQRVVYGLVGLIMVSVVGAILALVVVNK